MKCINGRLLRTAVATIAAFAFLAGVPAEAKVDLFRPIREGEPLIVRPDRAYVLLRTPSTGVAPIFLRIPTDSELDAYDSARDAAFGKEQQRLVQKRNAALERERIAKAEGRTFNETVPPVPSSENFNFIYSESGNVTAFPVGKPFSKSGGTGIYLVEVPPGDYVFYGLGLEKAVFTCLCLGTIGFTAPSGHIVDLGEYLIADATFPSAIPELAGETNLGYSVRSHNSLWTAAVRPASSVMPVPQLLSGHAIEPAVYRPIGKFISPITFTINRLAAVPGVLRYDGGRVIDSKTGGEVDSNF